jgi:hypothetical protein
MGAESTTMKCRVANCTAELRADATYCRRCGAPVEEPQDEFAADLQGRVEKSPCDEIYEAVSHSAGDAHADGGTDGSGPDPSLAPPPAAVAKRGEWFGDLLYVFVVLVLAGTIGAVSSGMLSTWGLEAFAFIIGSALLPVAIGVIVTVLFWLAGARSKLVHQVVFAAATLGVALMAAWGNRDAERHVLAESLRPIGAAGNPG